MSEILLWYSLARLSLVMNLLSESYADYEKLKELAVLLVKSGVKSVGLIDAEHALHWFLPRSKAA